MTGSPGFGTYTGAGSAPGALRLDAGVLNEPAAAARPGAARELASLGASVGRRSRP